MKKLLTVCSLIALFGCDDHRHQYVQQPVYQQQPQYVEQPVVVQPAPTVIVTHPDNGAAVVGAAALGYAVGSSMNQPRNTTIVKNKTVIVNQTAPTQTVAAPTPVPNPAPATATSFKPNVQATMVKPTVQPSTSFKPSVQAVKPTTVSIAPTTVKPSTSSFASRSVSSSKASSFSFKRK